MLQNARSSFQASGGPLSPTIEARRLRLEYNRLQRRRSALRGDAADEIEGLKAQIERVARELGQVRADSVHAVEAKLRVAMDLRAETGDLVTQRLLSSALSDLHYLAVLTSPPE